MNFGLRVRPQADRDVDEIAAYVIQGSIEIALQFFDAVNATYKIILESPRLPSVYPLAGFDEIRRKPVVGFENYLVFYLVDADMVEIVRVLHAARDFPSIFATPPQ